MMVVDGKPVPGTERVRSEISFAPGAPNTSRNRTKTWDGLALHWTGGENRSNVVRQTLKSRRCSVQFIGEKDGELVQTADLMTQCAHVGSPGNRHFLGIEMVSRGYATKADFEAAKATDPTLRDRDELDWTEARDTYTDVIGGDPIHMVAFAPLMIENMMWLADLLAERFNFPRVVPARRVEPTDATLALLPLASPQAFLVMHEGQWYLPAFDRDYSLTGRAATFRGALGHCHVHHLKHDPGSQPFYALWASGWNPAQIRLPGALASMGV